MSNIFFKSISFNKADYSYAFVDGRTLNIVLNGVEVPVLFASNEEAIEGVKELNDKLNGISTKKPVEKSDLDVLVDKIKSGELLTILDSCNEKLREVVGDVRQTVQDRLLDQAFKEVTKKTEERVDGMIKDIDAVLSHMFTKPFETKTDTPDEDVKEPTERVKPTIITKVKRSFGSLDDVFGFDNVRVSTDEKQEVADMLIGDMTTGQLKTEIDTFVTELLSSERAESMFTSINENFGKEATEQAVQAFKDLIYTVAISNPEKTLEEVLRQNFK